MGPNPTKNVLPSPAPAEEQEQQQSGRPVHLRFLQCTFAEALAKAQADGIAERDPSGSASNARCWHFPPPFHYHNLRTEFQPSTALGVASPPPQAISTGMTLRSSSQCSRPCCSAAACRWPTSRRAGSGMSHSRRLRTLGSAGTG